MPGRPYKHSLPVRRQWWELGGAQLTHFLEHSQSLVSLFLSNRSGSATALNGHRPPPENLRARIAKGLFPIMRNIKALQPQTPIALLGQIQRQWQRAVMEPLHPRVFDEPDPRLSLQGKGTFMARARPNGSAFAEFMIGAKNGPECQSYFYWQKALPAHQPRTDIGSRSQCMDSPDGMVFACCLRLVSTHTTPTFPYKLCMLCCHFRALPVGGRSGIFTIVLCYWHCTTRACSITFSAYTTLLESAHSYWRLISWCPEHLGINKSVTISLSQRHP